MKPIHVILTRVGGLEMLTIKGECVVGICAQRFEIEDRRGPVKPRRPAREPREREPS